MLVASHFGLYFYVIGCVKAKHTQTSQALCAVLTPVLMYSLQSLMTEVKKPGSKGASGACGPCLLCFLQHLSQLARVGVCVLRSPLRRMVPKAVAWSPVPSGPGTKRLFDKCSLNKGLDEPNKMCKEEIK